MATFDTWGGAWSTAWGTSWFDSTSVAVPPGGHGSTQPRKERNPNVQLAALIVSILTVIDDE